MASTMYAWTDIKHAKGVLKAGETATANKLGVDEEEWDQLVESRAVRPRKYPEMPRDFTGSPVEFVIQEHRKQLQDVEDVLLDEDVQVAAEAISRDETEMEEVANEDDS